MTSRSTAVALASVADRHRRGAASRAAHASLASPGSCARRAERLSTRQAILRCRACAFWATVTSPHTRRRLRSRSASRAAILSFRPLFTENSVAPARSSAARRASTLYAVSIPLCWLQPDTARELAVASRETLAAAAEAGNEVGGEARTDGEEPAQQLRSATPRWRRDHPAAGLQRRLTLTLSRAAVSKLRDEVLAADTAGRALHLAETGFCGVDAWASALPREHDRIDADPYRPSMAWSLGLPIAGFEGRTCRCGRHLTAADGGNC